MEGRSRRSLEVHLPDLALAAGEAMDRVDAARSGRHLRVATAAAALGRRVGLPPARLRDLVIAAVLHDCGALTRAGRLETLQFGRVRSGHAEGGWLLLRGFPPLAGAARIVRHHHRPWDGGRGERWCGEAVPLESHLLHLADRVDVLLRDRPGAGAAGAVASLRKDAGRLFVPELVEAFEEASSAERFWAEAAAGSAEKVAAAAAGGDALGTGELRGLVRVIEQIVDFRSRFTSGHSCAVRSVASHLAALCGADEEACVQIGVAAGLHDLGKLAVPVELLDAEAPLSPRDLELVRAHPRHGWQVLRRVRGFGRISGWASWHHERLDGSGYPFGLTGAQLPFESRVVAVADAFTALTEERPYRRGRSAREAAVVLAAEARSGKLDPEVVAELARRRDDLDALRRGARERAAQRFLEFRGRAAGGRRALPAA